MNSNATTHPAPVSGLLSLVADALEPATSGTVYQPVPEPAAHAANALGQMTGGWVAVREDGHGWLLLQFAPAAAGAHAAEQSVSADPEGNAAAGPIPTRPDLAGRSRRVHTSLTQREREVLRLVAVGATNRAIAARLFISPKTASVHVSRILTKLDAATRTEAAALAHASGLVRPWGSDPIGDQSIGLRALPA